MPLNIFLLFHFRYCPTLFPFPKDIKLMILADTGDRPKSRNLVRKCTGEEAKVAHAQKGYIRGFKN